MKKILLAIIGLFTSILCFAQDSAMAHSVQTASGMRADGKIYVVMAVVITILTGLFVYLITLDRKISKLEKNS